MRARQVQGYRADTSTTHARDATRRHPRTYLPMARTTSRPLDRVAERRRAAALARHYRDSERLSIAEIARPLGRAPAPVQAPSNSPLQSKERALAVGLGRAPPHPPPPTGLALSSRRTFR